MDSWLIYAACECQWTIHERNKRREKVEKHRLGLAIGGTIITAVSGGVTATLGVAVAGDETPSKVLTGATAGMASLTAAAGILAGIAALLPATAKQNNDTALAWEYWTLGLYELAKSEAASEPKIKAQSRQRAIIAFHKCASDHDIYREDRSRSDGDDDRDDRYAKKTDTPDPEAAASSGDPVVTAPAPRLVH